ncbi:MAG: NAD-dependent epimerase/dehydratase family protein [Cetobacterium sp.]|uniref:NAD-dependent epimerase/dehydratase family protein n=1 Tax=Cetobacterium sp. TaxID=2071632 RepID=UPI002FC7C884
MKKILLTGATGFVGSNLVRALIKRGYEVNILSRNSSNMWRLHDIYDKLKDWKVDLLEKEKLKQVIQEINPDYICHLAIYGGYPNQKEEKKIIETNFIGTINLLEALENIDFKCFINTGSSSEYGIKSKKMNEEDICNPITPYGIAKLSSTLYCNYKSLESKKNIGTLRLFSPYGDFEENGRLIPSLFTKLLKNENVDLANPLAARDFIYIKDVIELYLKVLEKPELIKGQIFNVCSGQQGTVGEVAEYVKEIVVSKGQLNYGNLEGRKFDTNIWVGDCEKISKVYDWQPQYSLKDGLLETYKWYKKNLLKY